MHSIFARRLKVVAERPYARLLAALMTGLLGAVLVLVGYHIGRSEAGTSGRSSDKAAVALGQSEQRVKELESRLADYNLSQLMDDDAYERLRQTIKGLRDRLAETEEEVRFYRQLMAPSEQDQGLRIERLELRSGPVPNEVEYRLLLTQVVDNHDWIQGAVRVDLVGRVDDIQQVLSLTELSGPEEYPLQFRFRYFQNFSGTLRIPDGFRPLRALVTAEQAEGDTPLEKTFVWQLEDN
jgi:hypothetical protein